MSAQEIKINMKDVLAEVYRPLFNDVMGHKHSRYVLPGGRGSLKSSTVSILIPLLIINYPNIHAACFRQVGATVQKSIFAQIEWAIYKLGLESLFKIPKNFATPIVYLPTGQQIICMGLDDPMKVKSIKLPFGYIGITWFEELDQFSGPEGLRKVTQSTKRGGDLFWDFRSFNPPISKNNWANEFAEDLELNPDDRSLVFRTDYTMVPEEWLGDEFIFEAEELKQKNPRAYEHEYMGHAIGTGGDVFPNVEEFDRDELVPAYAGCDKDEYVPRWQTFDQIYNGIDWGFARDPFRFVRVHFDKRNHDIYIFREYTTLKTRNIDVFEILYNEKKLVSKDELVTADSAEEKSVLDFKAYGAFIRGAEKGPESVRYGIKWLQGLNHIYIDRKHCPQTWKEFTNYEYEQDKDGNFISAYPDENNHSIDATRYALEKYWKRKGN